MGRSRCLLQLHNRFVALQPLYFHLDSKHAGSGQSAGVRRHLGFLQMEKHARLARKKSNGCQRSFAVERAILA